MNSYLPSHNMCSLATAGRCAVLAAAILFSGSANADTHTWNDGDPSNNLSDGANWNIGAPVAGDRLNFMGAAAGETLINDFATDTTFTLQFNAGFDYDLTGNRITLGNSGSNDIRQLNTAGNNTISLDLKISGSRDYNIESGTLTMAGLISGGTIVMRNGGTLVLKNPANSYTNTYVVNNNGTVQFDTGALGTGTVRLGWSTTTGSLEYIGSGENITNNVLIGRPNTANGGHTGGALSPTPGPAPLPLAMPHSTPLQTLQPRGISRLTAPAISQSRASFAITTVPTELASSPSPKLAPTP